MTDWVVRRWVRYGHDRLYAETPGRTELGYLDLKTGRYHSDDLSNLPLLKKAIADHLAAQTAQHRPELVADRPVDARPAAVAEPLAEFSQLSWHDLSTTPAGAAASERALVERQAQGRVRHFFAQLLGARTDERAWRLGAEGEQAVAAQLATLGYPWRTLHAVRVGDRGSDIDHLVIGPGSVYTVNAKHHPSASIWVGGDTFLVNGHRVPYVRNSRHEARRAARLLTEQSGFPVTATGVIAVMGARRGFKVKAQPQDGAVVVVPRRGIAAFLHARPERLTEREIAAIFDAARRSTTWRG